jgi:hypothetical protein
VDHQTTEQNQKVEINRMFSERIADVHQQTW